MPLEVSGFSLSSIRNATPILLIQLLDVSDLTPETPNLFPKNF